MGLPFEACASFRKGAAKGPVAIRCAFESIEEWSSWQNRHMEDHPFEDAGDLKLSAQPVMAHQETLSFAQEHADRLIFAIGGDHSVSIPLIQHAAEAHMNLAVVHMDAHLDLREQWDGNPLSHASVACRFLEQVSLDSWYPIGIRSGTREGFARAKQRVGLYQASSGDGARLARDLGGRPVYLTVDLDVLDPSELSGTGNPEPGGIRFSDWIAFISSLSDLNLVGMDLVELAPDLDPSGLSAVTAAVCTREMLLAFSNS